MQKRSETPKFTPIPEFRESEELAYLSSISLINKEGSGSSLPNYTTTGATSQLRQSLPIWDENTLIVIAEQRVEGLLEILPQLSKEVRYRIVSELQSSLQRDSQGEDRSTQESTLPSSDSDMERADRAEHIMQSILSKPQKKTNFFRMAGVFKEPFSSNDD